MMLLSFLLALLMCTRMIDAFNLHEKDSTLAPASTSSKKFGLQVATKIDHESAFVVSALASDSGEVLSCDAAARSCSNNYINWGGPTEDYFFGLSAAAGFTYYAGAGPGVICWKNTIDNDNKCRTGTQHTSAAVLSKRSPPSDLKILHGKPGSYDGASNTVDIYDVSGSRSYIRGSGYFGYEIHTRGDFNNDGINDVAVGAPRYGTNAPFYRGAVMIHLGPVQSSATLTLQGTQHGSYFGASMCAGDFNADNMDDLCVGAPQYIVEGKRDVGQVTCYLNSGGSHPALVPNDPQILSGTAAGERFGFSLTSGDFDDDGYTDLLVGAPFFEIYVGETYEETSYKGRIFVYNGNDRGLQTEYSQVILGKQGTSRLGYSISAFTKPSRRPSVLISALGEKKVYRYESLPVHDLSVTIQTDLSGDFLKLDTKFFKYNITFTNLGNSDIPAKGIRFYVVLDGRTSVSSAGTALSSIISSPIRAGEPFTVDINVTVAIPSISSGIDFADAYGTPVIMITTWENDLDESFSLRKKEMRVSKEVQFLTGCVDDVCDTTLEVTIESEIEKVVPTTKVEYTVRISNTGDDVALSTVISISATLDITKFSASNEADCNYESAEFILICAFDNLEKTEQRSVTFTVDSTNLPLAGTLIEATASTRSILDNPNNATSSKRLDYISYTDAEITGHSQNESVSSKIVIGRDPIEHKYEISQTPLGHNEGGPLPPLRDVSVEIYWPYKLLYPIDIRTRDGLGVCDRYYIDNCSEKKTKYSEGEEAPTYDENCNLDEKTRPSCKLNDPRFPEYVPDNSTTQEGNILDCEKWTDIYITFTCHFTLIEDGIVWIIVDSLPNSDYLLNNEDPDFNPYGFIWAPSLANLTKVDTEETSTNAVFMENSPLNNVDGTSTMLRPIKDLIVTPKPAKKKKTPSWIIIVAIIGALLLVFIILAALMKAGFFQRKKPPTEEDNLIEGDDAEEPGPDATEGDA